MRRFLSCLLYALLYLYIGNDITIFSVSVQSQQIPDTQRQKWKKQPLQFRTKHQPNETHHLSPRKSSCLFCKCSTSRQLPFGFPAMSVGDVTRVLPFETPQPSLNGSSSQNGEGFPRISSALHDAVHLPPFSSLRSPIRISYLWSWLNQLNQPLNKKLAIQAELQSLLRF